MTEAFPHRTQSIMLKSAPLVLRVVCALAGVWELAARGHRA